jgi:hypothetical protein
VTGRDHLPLGELYAALIAPHIQPVPASRNVVAGSAASGAQRRHGDSDSDEEEEEEEELVLEDSADEEDEEISSSDDNSDDEQPLGRAVPTQLDRDSGGRNEVQGTQLGAAAEAPAAPAPSTIADRAEAGHGSRSSGSSGSSGRRRARRTLSSDEDEDEEDPVELQLESPAASSEAASRTASSSAVGARSASLSRSSTDAVAADAGATTSSSGDGASAQPVLARRLGSASDNDEEEAGARGSTSRSGGGVPCTQEELRQRRLRALDRRADGSGTGVPSGSSASGASSSNDGDIVVPPARLDSWVQRAETAVDPDSLRAFLNGRTVREALVGFAEMDEETLRHGLQSMKAAAGEDGNDSRADSALVFAIEVVEEMISIKAASVLTSVSAERSGDNGTAAAAATTTIAAVDMGRGSTTISSRESASPNRAEHEHRTQAQGNAKAGSDATGAAPGMVATAAAPTPAAVVAAPTTETAAAAATAASPVPAAVTAAAATPVETWLRSAGLGEHAAKFAEERIDMFSLGMLSEEDLRDLGLPLGHRRRFQAYVEMMSSIGGA